MRNYKRCCFFTTHFNRFYRESHAVSSINFSKGIVAAPVDLVEGIRPAKDGRPARDYFDVVKWSIEEIQDQDLRVTMTKIMEALNLDNFDESDSQSDYFHVGHYVRLKVGSDVKGFKFISGV